MTEARVKVVDDDTGFAALFGPSGQLAGRIHLEELGDLVSAVPLGQKYS